MRSALIVCGSLLLVSACEAGPTPARREAPLREPEGSGAPAHQVGVRDVVLDVRDDGAQLLGRVLPVAPGTDADRLIEARLEVDGNALPLGFLSRVIDARFVGPRVAFVDEAHVLWAVSGGDPIRVDEHVEAPLAVRGDDLVYARGEMPFFELARVRLASREITALTEGYAPAYSPAIDEDASVVFVSTREGRPRLHRVDVHGRVTALPPTERTPSSPRAPSVTQGRLTFEDERGVVTIELATGRVVGATP